jgi:hypothetical protein
MFPRFRLGQLCRFLSSTQNNQHDAQPYRTLRDVFLPSSLSKQNSPLHATAIWVGQDTILASPLNVGSPSCALDPHEIMERPATMTARTIGRMIFMLASKLYPGCLVGPLARRSPPRVVLYRRDGPGTRLETRSRAFMLGLHQYSSASMIVITRSVTVGSAGFGECPASTLSK